MASSISAPAAALAARPFIGKQKHLPALDGVRAIAILMVMFFHFFQHLPVQSNSFWRLFGKLTSLGQTGVDLFFVLSGFLITGILLDSRGKRNALKFFYLRRTLRIFPLYYFYLLAAFTLLPALHLAPRVPVGQQWWFWLYCENIQDTFVRNFTMWGPGHFWSLAVEEHFYLVWPFLVMSVSRRRLRYVLFGIAVLALAVRAVLVATHYPVYYFTLCRIDALAAGGLLALIARQGNALPSAGTWIRKHIWWFLIGLAVAYLVLTGTANPLVQVVKFSVSAVLFTTLLTVALTLSPGGKASRILGCRGASAIAQGSYAMYVFHPAIFDFVRPRLLPLLPMPMVLVAAFAATFAVAWLSWNGLEKPFLNLRDHIQQKVKAADRSRYEPIAS